MLGVKSGRGLKDRLGDLRGLQFFKAAPGSNEGFATVSRIPIAITKLTVVYFWVLNQGTDIGE